MAKNLVYCELVFCRLWTTTNRSYYFFLKKQHILHWLWP